MKNWLSQNFNYLFEINYRAVLTLDNMQLMIINPLTTGKRPFQYQLPKYIICSIEILHHKLFSHKLSFTFNVLVNKHGEMNMFSCSLVNTWMTVIDCKVLCYCRPSDLWWAWVIVP